MADKVSFKVFMTTENKLVKEVRRFGVEVDVVTNFVYIREKLQTIFPTLRGRHFTVSWKDWDGDYVAISSDEELQIALDETSSNDIRKLYVVLHPEFSSPRNPTLNLNDSGPIHVGVTCDGCDKQIQGFRYKCVQCPDYDLCVDCESRGTHPEHCMIRLSVPLQWKPHYGKRLACHVNRFVKKAQSQANKESESRQCPFKSGRHHGKSHHGGETQSWIDTFVTYLDEWANLPGDCPMKETVKEAKETVSPTSSAKSDTPPNGEEKRAAEQVRLLTNVGLAVGENFLSQFLDPLINMHAKNDKSTNPSNILASTSGSPNNEKDVPSTIANESSTSAKFPGEGKKLREPMNEDDAVAAASSQPAVPSEKVSAEKNFENEGWLLLNKSDSSASSVFSQISSSTGAVPKQVQPTPVEASPQLIYPKLPEAPQKKPVEVPIVYHPNPTIQKSVESMIQMGFSNEGGWLTNLLISKGGDIAAALDALSPVKR